MAGVLTRQQEHIPLVYVYISKFIAVDDTQQHAPFVLIEPLLTNQSESIVVAVAVKNDAGQEGETRTEPAGICRSLQIRGYMSSLSVATDFDMRTPTVRLFLPMK